MAPSWLTDLADAAEVALTSTDPTLAPWPAGIGPKLRADAALADRLKECLDGVRQGDVGEAITALAGLGASVLTAGQNKGIAAEKMTEVWTVWSFRTIQVWKPLVAAGLAAVGIYRRSAWVPPFESLPAGSTPPVWEYDLGGLLRLLAHPVTFAVDTITGDQVASLLLRALAPRLGLAADITAATVALPPGMLTAPAGEAWDQWYALRLPLSTILGAISKLKGDAGGDGDLLAPDSPDAAVLLAVRATHTGWEVWLDLSGDLTALTSMDIGKGWTLALNGVNAKAEVTDAASVTVGLGAHAAPPAVTRTWHAEASSSGLSGVAVRISRGSKTQPLVDLGDADLVRLSLDEIHALGLAALLKPPSGDARVPVVGAEVGLTATVAVASDWLKLFGADPALLSLSTAPAVRALTGRPLAVSDLARLDPLDKQVPTPPPAAVPPTQVPTRAAALPPAAPAEDQREAALEARLDLNISEELGPVRLALRQVLLRPRMRVDTVAGNDRFDARLELGLTARVVAGPLLVDVTDMGVWVGRWGADWVGLLVPSGFGLLLDLDGIRGGGSVRRIDTPTGDRYEGALQLCVQDFGINAIGILERTSSGQRSAVLVMGVTFSPGITLPYGFMITGFGGVGGFNRRMDLDAIKARLQGGAAGNVLFVQDPVANAPKVLPHLAAMFPAADGKYVFGPTARATWGGQVLAIDVGVVLELPDLARWLVFGRVRLPAPGSPLQEVLRLQLDVAGTVDLTQKTISVFASLVDSQILQVFTVSGDSLVEIGYGATPYFLLSVGGWHPQYPPEPRPPQTLARMGAAVKRSEGDLTVSLRLEAYLAQTLTSFQIGAAVSLHAELKNTFRVDGFLGFDAVVAIDPFMFRVVVRASVSLEAKIPVWGWESVCDADFTGTLRQDSATDPLWVEGSVTARICRKGVSRQFSKPFGSPKEPLPAPLPNLIDIVVAELWSPQNVRAELLADPHVVLAAADPGEPIPVLPIGAVVWSQRHVPLATPITRVDGRRLAGPQSVTLTGSGVQVGVDQPFAVGMFTDLTRSQALDSPAFEALPSGARLSASGTVHGPKGSSTPGWDTSTISLKKDVRTVTHVSPSGDQAPVTVIGAANAAAAARHAPPQPRPRQGPAVRVRGRESWIVLGPDGQERQGEPGSGTAALVAAAACGGVALPVADTRHP